MPTHHFRLNGQNVTVDAPGDLGLLYVLRDLLNITGPKYGCGVGVCRACTCHLDGEEFQPCITPVSDVAGRRVTTIEGLAQDGELHPVQQAWLDLDVAQCGFCQPGQIMTAAALLRRNHSPTDADIDAIENVCRCGTYARIRAAIRQASSGSRRRGAPESATEATTGGSSIPAASQVTAGPGAEAPSAAEEPLPATGAGAAGTGSALIAAAANLLRRPGDG